MTPLTTATQLCSFAGRRGGSDAERRASVWLRARLLEQGRPATVETFWSRPDWALAHFWHALFGVLASVVIVANARVGGALALLVLVSVAVDAVTGRSLGRRLTPERASQNIVALAPADHPGPRLVVTANYDAGRAGAVYRPGPRALAATLRRIAADGRLTPGWLGWLSLGLLSLVVVALVRDAAGASTAVDVAQLGPTIGLLLGAAALLELSSSATSPAAGDNASGVAIAIAAIAAHDAAPGLGSIAVDLVLQGASDGDGAGLRQHLRRRSDRPASVLGIGPCGAGRPSWWISDGPLWPLRYDRGLRALAAASGSSAGHRGRGSGPALMARAAGLPAITIGCLDERGLAPRSHRQTDVPVTLDPDALDAALRFTQALIAALAGRLGSMGS